MIIAIIGEKLENVGIGLIRDQSTLRVLKHRIWKDLSKSNIYPYIEGMKEYVKI